MRAHGSASAMSACRRPNRPTRGVTSLTSAPCAAPTSHSSPQGGGGTSASAFGLQEAAPGSEGDDMTTMPRPSPPSWGWHRPTGILRSNCREGMKSGGRRGTSRPTTQRPACRSVRQTRHAGLVRVLSHIGCLDRGGVLPAAIMAPSRRHHQIAQPLAHGQAGP